LALKRTIERAFPHLIPIVTRRRRRKKLAALRTATTEEKNNSSLKSNSAKNILCKSIDSPSSVIKPVGTRRKEKEKKTIC